MPAAGFDEAEILRLAASVERASEHPLADAIVRAAKERHLDLGKVEDFDSPTGKGATGKVDGKIRSCSAMRNSWHRSASRRSRLTPKPNACAATAPP